MVDDAGLGIDPLNEAPVERHRRFLAQRREGLQSSTQNLVVLYEEEIT